jgi:hypothetical protein
MSQAILKALLTTLACAGLFAPAALAGVDPALLALVSPDARMLAGIQVSQTQVSPFGKYLLSQIQLDKNANQIMTSAGFDPRRDLREIVAASGDGSSGLVLGRGSFQPAKMSKAAVLAGAVSSTYRGVEVLSLNGAGKGIPAGSVAFLDASTVAAGDANSVKAVIDRRAGGKAFSGPLADRAREISVANDAWLASLTPPASLTGGATSGATGGSKGAGGAQNSPLGSFQSVLQGALQLSAAVRFSATEVTLSVEVLARSAQDAQSMADLVRFLAGMLQASRAQDPNAPNASKLPSLAEAAKVSSTGSMMHLVLSVPEQEMEQLFVPDFKPPAAPKKIAAR